MNKEEDVNELDGNNKSENKSNAELLAEAYEKYTGSPLPNLMIGEEPDEDAFDRIGIALSKSGEFSAHKMFMVREKEYNAFSDFTSFNLIFLKKLRLYRNAVDKEIEENIENIKESVLPEKEKAKMIKAQKEKRLTGVDYEVMLCLLENSDFGNELKVSQQEIANMLNKGKTAISRSMRKLEEYGIIIVTRKAGRHKMIVISPEASWKGKGIPHHNAVDKYIRGADEEEEEEKSEETLEDNRA